MKDIVQIMMNLIKSEISQTALDFSAELTEDELNVLYDISKSHDLAHLVGHSLIKNSLLKNDKISKMFKKEVHESAFRYIKLEKAKEEIASAFEDEKIFFIPLKGCVLREYYPEPWMRTSCDIDILVKKEDLKRASDVLENRFGYIQKFYTEHDISFFTENEEIHIELHYSLEPDDNENDNFLASFWNFAKPVDDLSFQLAVPDEYFYCYHIIHMAKHFVGGGCGVRPFVDLWVLNHRTEFDEHKRLEVLNSTNYSTFAKSAERLSEIWFGNDVHNELTKQMEEYITGAGIYGTLVNRVVVSQVRKGNKIKYILYRIWLPYNLIKYRYPILQKHQWLQPLFEVLRWVELLFNGRLSLRVNELKSINNTSQTTKNRLSSMLTQLGFKD